MKRRIPEHVSSAVRKIEPAGGGLARLYFSLASNGAWDDQVTILMPNVRHRRLFEFRRDVSP
jgi:hypothetical protein